MLCNVSSQHFTEAENSINEESFPGFLFFFFVTWISSGIEQFIVSCVAVLVNTVIIFLCLCVFPPLHIKYLGVPVNQVL